MNGITKFGIALLLSATAYTAITCGGNVGNKKSPSNMPPPATAPLKQEFYNPFSEIPMEFKSEPEFIGTTEMETIRQLSELALSNLYRANHARGFPAFPDGVSRIIVKTEKVYTLPKGNLESMIEGSDRVIGHLKNYLSGVALSWPTIEYIAPKSESEIRQGLKPMLTSDELSKKVQFYVVDDVQNYATFEVKLRYAVQVEEFTIKINFGSVALGKIRREDILQQDGGTIPSIKSVYGNILVIREEGSDLTTLTAEEYLHVATFKYLESHRDKLLESTPSLEGTIRASGRAQLLNEYVMHGTGLEFASWYGDANANKDRIIAGGKRSGWTKDPNVQKMAQLIKGKGPEYVFRMYHDDPERLILESGVSIR